MQRFLALLGSVLASVLFTMGLFLPVQIAQATSSCQFACQVMIGSQGQNCNPRSDSGGIPTVAYTPCATQCRSICEGAGMAYDTTALRASTCQAENNLCSPCSCIPNVAIACIARTSGAPDAYCAEQCFTTCQAKGPDITRQVQGATIRCAYSRVGGAPALCVAIPQDAAIRVCRACITTCVNDVSGGAQRPARTCYSVCNQEDHQNACAGVSITEANVAAITPTDTSPTGRSTGGGTPSAGGTAPPGAAGTQGSCNFVCKAQVPPTTCTTDADCATPCQTTCSRSFRNGQCVTSGAGAARCADVGSGMPKQCVFECSIGASEQERSCNPQGTDAEAPGRVCGSFCQEACRSASTQQPPPTGSFCGGSAPTCVGANGTTPSTSSPSNGSTPTGGASGAGPGTRLRNPLGSVDTVADLVGRLIKGILGVVGSVALLMFTYGGIKWIVSAGDAKEVTGAQHIIRNATIGLVLIFFSYTISNVVLGFLADIGRGGTDSTSTSSAGGTGLASCVQYAVTHGYIGQNEAQDTTSPQWACRQTAVAERTNHSVCIAHGCPNDGATVLCCAPASNTAPAPSSGSTGGTGGGTAGTPPAASAGCRTRIAASFHLRPTETVDSVGDTIPAGTSVDVLGAGTLVRTGTLIHHIRVVGGAEGWAFLTPAEVAACRAP